MKGFNRGGVGFCTCIDHTLHPQAGEPTVLVPRPLPEAANVMVDSLRRRGSRALPGVQQKPAVHRLDKPVKPELPELTRASHPHNWETAGWCCSLTFPSTSVRAGAEFVGLAKQHPLQSIADRAGSKLGSVLRLCCYRNPWILRGRFVEYRRCR